MKSRKWECPMFLSYNLEKSEKEIKIRAWSNGGGYYYGCNGLFFETAQVGDQGEIQLPNYGYAPLVKCVVAPLFGIIKIFEDITTLQRYTFHYYSNGWYM